jgi:hypothetical protein
VAIYNEWVVVTSPRYAFGVGAVRLACRFFAPALRGVIALLKPVAKLTCRGVDVCRESRLDSGTTKARTALTRA